MPTTYLAAVLLATLVCVVVGLRAAAVRRRVHDRMFDETDVEPELIEMEADQGRLARWLFLAGYRRPQHAPLFVMATVSATGVGVLLVAAIYGLGITRQMADLFSSVPGGVGEVFVPLVLLSPWILLVTLAAIPTLVVRSARRERVRQVEQDLPIVLDLLSTLAEAGLGLDAAIDRVLAAQSSRRALTQELRAFQRDVLAGRPRVDSLRRLARRVEVAWFSIVVAAVVQAEQIGAGIAEVLRVQADDLRERRREQALALASSTPVKLLLPLIVCFLPGVFVAALGPTFYQLFQLLDSFLQSGSPGP